MSSAFFAILLCVAILATLILGSWIFEFHKSDAAGQGMTKGFSVVLDIFLLIVIGVMLLIAGTRGRFPGQWGWIAILLFAAGAAAQFYALIVLTDLESGVRFETALRLLVPAGAGLLITLAAVHYYAQPQYWVAIAAAAVAALSVALAPGAKAETNARTEARAKAYQERRERDLTKVAKIRALPADTAVIDLLAYTDVPVREESDARQAAISRIREHHDRQAQIETALATGDVRAFRYLSNFELAATPSLCEAARQCARVHFAKLHPTQAEPTFSSVEDQLNPLGEQLRWLIQGGCDCKSEIALLEQSVRQYPDPYPKKFFLDYLLELQGKPRE
jgi:hypothetical protein